MDRKHCHNQADKGPGKVGMVLDRYKMSSQPGWQRP